MPRIPPAAISPAIAGLFVAWACCPAAAEIDAARGQSPVERAAPRQGEEDVRLVPADGPSSENPMRLPQIEATPEMAGGLLQPIPEDPLDEECAVKLWSSSIEFGLSGTDGNSETFNMRLGAKTQRKTEFSTFTFEMTHVNQTAEAVRTARNALFDGRAEWPLSGSQWTYFAHLTGEYDEFKPFDFRLAADTGLGRLLVDRESTTLLGRIGGSTSREIGGPEDEWVPELVAGLEFEHALSPRQRLTASAEYFPDVTAFHEYRFNTRGAWEIVVDPDWGLSLKLSAILRLDSTPNGGKEADTDYAALLLWSF